MKGSGKKINKLFRNFFLWVRSREFLVFLFFLLVSGFFWGVLAVKEPAERELEIPIKLDGQPSKVFFNDSLPSTLKVTVKDNGYNLIGYYFDKVDTIPIRFAKYSRDDGKLYVSNSELFKMVKTELERSTEILSIKPDKLDVYYNNYDDTMKVKVALIGEFVADDNYVITMKQLKPDSVIIYANQQQLHTIDSVKTQYVRFKDISQQVRKVVKLQKINGVMFKPDQVTLTVNVDVLKEDSKEVHIEAINVPDNVVLNLLPSNVPVSYVTGSSLMEGISDKDFRVVVDYNDIEGGPEGTLPLQLLSWPSFVKRPQLVKTKVEFLIEQKR